MARRDIIVVGTSAGGVEALAQLVAACRRGSRQRFSWSATSRPMSRSILPQILSGAGPLPAVHAEDRVPFLPGHIYVAPPDRHLLLAPDGRMRVNCAMRAKTITARRSIPSFAPRLGIMVSA